MVPETQARFWTKVDSREPDQCWPWLAYVDEESGYGQFWDGERLVKAHRLSYQMEHGPIPPGKVIDHACHNQADCTEVPCEHRRCCNPRHLQAVTQSINSILGRTGDHQSAKTECPKGHPYSPENTILRNGGRHRLCRACNRIHQSNYNAKRKAA